MEQVRAQQNPNRLHAYGRPTGVATTTVQEYTMEGIYHPGGENTMEGVDNPVQRAINHGKHMEP